MDITKLKAELVDDPLTRGYASMSDEAAANSLNDTIDRSLNRTSISPGEMQSAVVGSEFVALSAAKQRGWLAILSDSVDPNNANIVAQIAEIWVGGTTTRANLIALKTETVSRGVELGLGNVKVGYVEQARAE